MTMASDMREMELKACCWRQRLHAILEPAEKDDRTSRAFDIFLVSLIALNVVAVVLETVEAVGSRFAGWFRTFELLSVAVFTIEYVLRLWVCTTEKRYARPVGGRVRFALHPLMIIDLLAFLPSLLPILGIDGRPLRALRLMRVFRILKLARYSTSLQIMGRVFRAKSADLAVTATALCILLLVASSLMYYAERNAQPDLFSSIPATMWWGVATLTTVGYGDAFPITTVGRCLGGVIAVLGIGLFALPAGLLASGFTEELEKRRLGPPCPHCGQPIPRNDGHAPEPADEIASGMAD